MQSLDAWYIDKKACRPLYRYHSQHKPPGAIHPPILHIGILDSLRNRSRDQINDLYYDRVPVPFWDRHPGSGPQGVGGWGLLGLRGYMNIGSLWGEASACFGESFCLGIVAVFPVRVCFLREFVLRGIQSGEVYLGGRGLNLVTFERACSFNLLL